MALKKTIIYVCLIYYITYSVLIYSIFVYLEYFKAHTLYGFFVWMSFVWGGTCIGQKTALGVVSSWLLDLLKKLGLLASMPQGSSIPAPL